MPGSPIINTVSRTPSARSPSSRRRDSAGTPAATAAAVEVRGLVKRFGDRTAVDRLDLTLERGEILALLGPNGAGKSTTIGVISSLVNKSAGKVKVFGHDIDTDLELAKSQLGLVPQEFNFNQFEKTFDTICVSSLPSGRLPTFVR